VQVHHDRHRQLVAVRHDRALPAHRPDRDLLAAFVRDLPE
jgi:hypothetical protein